MKKLMTMVMAGCFVVTAGSVLAQDTMKKDGMGKMDKMEKKDGKKDGMAKDGMKKDAMGKKDEMKKDGMGKMDKMEKKDGGMMKKDEMKK